MNGRLWQVVLKMETTAGAPKHVSRNFYPSPPRSQNPVLVRHRGAGSYLTVGPAPDPSSLWAVGFPTCKTRRLDIDPRRAPPTRKCQVRVSGPFPQPQVSVPALSLSQGAGWSEMSALFPSFGPTHQGAGWEFGESQKTGQGQVPASPPSS